MTAEQSALLDALAPIRMPGEFAHFGLGDFVSFCALGILAGVLISSFIAPYFHKTLSPRERTKSKIEALRVQDDDARWLGLYRLAVENNVALDDSDQETLYNPHTQRSFSAMEERILSGNSSR